MRVTNAMLSKAKHLTIFLVIRDPSPNGAA
jgi:hypothetical protein